MFKEKLEGKNTFGFGSFDEIDKKWLEKLVKNL
jgi:hypothetical protein